MSPYTRYATVRGTLPPAVILAIASARHSGSTLLDLLIGSHSLIASAGEMNRVSLYPSDRACTCGEMVAACPYWSAVLARLSAGLGAREALRWEEVHTDVPPLLPVLEIAGVGTGWLVEGPIARALAERLGAAGLGTSAAAVLSRTGTRDLKWKLTEPGQPDIVVRHEGGGLQIYTPLREWKNPLRLLPDPLEVALAFGGAGAVRRLSRFSPRAASSLDIARNSWHVADAMAAETGARYILDSSKSAVRLKLLYLTRPEAMRIVWLVRDGRAVTASVMRSWNLPATLAARTWKREHQHLSLVLRSVPDRLKLRVKYEDICEDPERELQRISAFLGLEYEPQMATLWQRPVHNIPGNSMLFRKSQSTIRHDDRWRRDLKAGDVAAFDQVAGRMNRELGYA